MEHTKHPKFILSVLGIAAVTAIVIVALVREPFPEPEQQFSVTGEGRVTVAPDVAVVRVGFATQPKVSAAEAVKENTFIMNRVLAVVADAGIKREDVKTVNYTLTPQYEYPDGRQRLLGYVASQDAQIKIRDLAKVGEVIAAATSAGANQVSDIQFTLENPEAAQAEARQKAIAKAQGKAETISRDAGLRLEKLINIFESEPPIIPGPVFGGRGGEALGGPVPVQQGMYEVVSQVTLVYEVD